ncbi:sacsin-like [Actinia tenebrosa]|uniref:Sacsin-like n=1 Tax=Actinia tenebrosa TaxID=6105 RepID=A0A6P8IGW1_ACTTE|nr:sacsin-like [Actinia tenebrosa]XP_031565982.1 sacsin-like [Actinia tenebrosa]XP_031565983.1 sacsin-like [Actinia tenebrosa]
MDRVRHIQGQSYGQRRPSLTAVLRRILEGYPDGGQILKELIQNADDAGATEVKFLFDSRDNAFGSTSLIHPELSKFQGPALYVYNNGLFKERDWHGIEGIMQGNKRLDPLSAGRFGVGFNSVYHITDLPSVVSDHFIAFLDPQETFFGAGETGRRFDLRDSLLERYSDQFAPYEDVLGCKISSGILNGTLFRFPLRKWPSRVSVKPYSGNKVKALFESLIEEAPILLLFLKNVETIRFCETTRTEQERETFSITIKDSLKASIRSMRKRFIQVALERTNEPYEMTYEMVLEEWKNGKFETEHKYMVLNRVGSDDKKLLEISAQLHLLPWAGVAASLNQTKVTTGRVFSFLPLPPESDCRTGLSVHIHGTFGVTDNRRNLKWAGAECQNDDTAFWNNYLLTDVISKAYAHLIIKLTQSQYPAYEILPVVSSILPDLDRIQGHWKLLLEPFFNELADKPVFWTEAEGGKWIALKDAVLNRLPRTSAKTRPEVRAAAVKCLIQANQPVVSLPEHALQAVDDYLVAHVQSVQEITPAYVRRVLKQTKNHVPNGGNQFINKRRMDWTSIDRNERIQILEFVMKDGDLQDLEGLPLLPLANKTFTEFCSMTFDSNPEKAVFVPSRTNPPTLIPGAGHRFLDSDVNEAVLTVLKSVTLDAEKQNTSVIAPTQLVFFAPFLVPGLLKDALPDEWRGDSVIVPWDPKDEQAGEVWLKGLWSWLRTEFSNDLSQFEGVPLVPLTSKRIEAKHLIKLKNNHSVIQGSSHFAALPRNVVGALQRTGCVVLSHIPMFCDHLDLRRHLEPPTQSGVLKVLSTVIEEDGGVPLSVLSLDEKRALRAFLSSLRNPSDDEIVTLMSLPIFETVSGNVTSLQPEETLAGRKLDVAPPRLSLPGDILIPESDQIISAADEDSYQLLRRLPVRILNMSNFLIEKVFPFIEKQTFYTRSQVTELMTWVLNRLPVLSSENRSFPEHLKTLKFVPVANNKFKAPFELFDPADEILKHLFDGEPSAFPCEEFSTSHTLSLLRVFLGLRRSRSLDGQDALTIAKQISDMSEEKASKRAAALLNFLNENFYLMDTEVVVDEESDLKLTLKQALCRFQWLPVSKDPPGKYPSTMSWFRSSQFLYSPSEMRDMEGAFLVGSAMPIVHVPVNKKLKKAFGWENPPPLMPVLEQLKTAVKQWKGQDKKPHEVESLKFQTMLREIYDYLSSQNTLTEAIAALKSPSFGPWVWYGSGFALPNCVAFHSTCPFDLKPYLLTMPEEFRIYDDLMLGCGVRESFGEENILDVLPAIYEARLMKKDRVDVKRDLYLVTEILHYATNTGKPLPDDLKKKVFVPIKTAGDTLCLKPLHEVSYCDTNIQDDEDLSFLNVAHESIATRTLQLLGVQPLNRSLNFVETLGFEQSGPHEPVTTRLQNILKEYQDGFCLFKELIQNADDAGATEVKFLIDWRRNPCGRLLSPEMADAQGPALWEYNNALFTDTDFENINKLAGATKMDSFNKIGRFGLGFCTTYNITDIPSFVSREFLVVFDPQTNHLGPLIKDKTRPGIRLNLKKNPKALVAFSDQFLPYQNVFECQMKELEDGFYYDGTLFRFPLRTKEQAETSEISDKHYDEEAFKELVCSFRENASNLLLFVNNVKKITFYEMEASSEESKMNLLFELKKDIVKTVSKNQSSRSKSDSYLTLEHSKDSTYTLQESDIISLESKTYPCKWFQNNALQTNYQVWLASFSGGRDLSIDLSATEEGKLKGLVSRAGVAALLSSSEEKSSALKPKAITGEAFFSLPLSIETGLPVHVNGCFAVTTNRRGLWEDTLAEHGTVKPFEILWNQTLLEDAASIAYVQLLEDLVKLNKEGKVGDFHFEVLWPDPALSPSKIWKRFVSSVYQRINESSAPLMRSSSRWVSVEEGVHLDEKVRRLPECYIIMQDSGYQVVDLPLFVHEAYVQAKLKPELIKRTITLERFLRDIFFENISDFSIDVRESVISCVLDEYLKGSTSFAKFLMDKCCIPTSPDGQVLVSPNSLIDPKGAAAELYFPNEHRFPFGDVISTEGRLVVLRKLGMVEDILSWQAICERATSIVKMKNDKQMALQRIRSLISYLNLNLSKLDVPSQSEVELLRSISFLPVLDQPADYCIAWKGSYKPSKRGIALLAPVNLFSDDLLYLLGTSKAILDETSETGCGKLTPQCLKLLGISTKNIETEDVLFQLSSAVQATRMKRTNINWHCIREICFSVYRYLQGKLQTPEKQAILEILQEKPWIFVDSKFVGCKQVAFDWNGHGDPFLYHLPHELAMEFRDLFEASGVRKTFSADDYIEALFSFQERKQGQLLTQSEFKTTKAFLDEISELDEDAIGAFYKHLPMPDSEQVLRPVGQLVVNDAPWLQQNDAAQTVHPDISAKLAHSLGAHSIRDVTLNKYSRCMGKPFGQVEHLTFRLKNILASYPCDTGILKEILQNADDAQATEVQFVYDPRQHGTEHVLNENWKQLQGPALCVYNNRPFTNEDIEGIQKLEEKIGRYGIGFNAVYHLTDCPSFISNGNTLCILDPHAKYAPDATRDSPGRLLEPLDFQFRGDFIDVMNGYLEDLFDLEGGTMFRFPLRTKAMAESSEISRSSFDDLDIERLLNAFEAEAKDALLFLNSVRKITISLVIDDRLTTKCQVTASISEESNNKLQEMSSQVRLCKSLSTKDIPWYGVTYLMKISDSRKNAEEWLIHQCIGAEQYIEEDEIPDGKRLGLLPCGGLAASVGVKDAQSKVQETRQQKSKHSKTYHVFSSLPLPAETGLPVHVNGHFVLDHSRRNLLSDQEGIGARSEWNEFLKNEILAPAYGKLLLHLRERISGIREGSPWFFISKRDVHFGLKWYQSLFPDPDLVHTEWKAFAQAVFKNLASKPVLPVLKGQDELTNSSSPPLTTGQSTEFSLGAVPTPCLWMSPASYDEDEQAYFSDLDETIEKLLLSIGFPLVFSASSTFKHFKDASVSVKKVSPDVVIKFLRSPKCKMGAIPCAIKDSKLKDISNLALLIKYCMSCVRFVTGLHGLPLLLTEDEVLRRFDIDHPIFFTPFLDLVPKQKELFLHREFVMALSNHMRDPIKKTGIFKRFDTISLEPYLVHLLPSSWFGIDKPIQWDPSTESIPTREWLTLLWKLIHKTFQDRKVSYHKRDECAKILRPIEDWPILPTSTETLVSIAFGKTVLDLTTHGPENEKLVTILRKLGCAELDFSILPGLETLDLSQLVSTYLAKPNSRLDLVSVLEHLMKEKDISEVLEDNEILVLFNFLQEDVTTVYSHKNTLRSLPFFKTLNGKNVSLGNYVSAYILELPKCVLLENIEARVEMEGCVLLQEIPELDTFYKALDIYRISKCEVFVKYILPNLDAMTAEGRESVLTYIRQSLLPPLTDPNERSIIIDTLIDINILPDKSGELAPARHFYDPGNAVFKSMLPLESFPQGEFVNEKWLPLLREIGLKQTVTQQDFIEFAESIASEAELTPSDPVLKDKSKALVTYLLEEESLHEASFLHVISQIKFIAAEAASENLRNLYVQFESKNKDDTSLYTAFHGAVSHECQAFLWSSVPLLPPWALPKGGENQRTLVENLGIEIAPPVDKVIKHLENLSLKYAGNVNKDTPKDQRELLHDVIYNILGFFKTETACPPGNPSERCTKSCQTFGNILRKTPCIPVEEGRVFVQGKQLAFEISEELPPFLYKVPREYGHLEHVLKRLGAQEKTSPVQYANVLARLKEVCEDKHMEPNEKRVARLASQGFFSTVSVLLKEANESSVTALLTKINELYLPSKGGFLKLSYELIVYDNPSFERRASEFAASFVDIAREGELTADRLAHLFKILPPRLRARNIQSIIHEEFHPCSRDKHCIADTENDQCPFIARYRDILLSPKFFNGIIRVIKHQRQTANIPQEVRDQVHVLSMLKISCMGSVDTHLVHLETKNPIKNSKESQDCFLEEKDKEWQLYIKHGTDENPLHIQLCFLINRLIGNYIEKEIYLQAMLSCRVPEDILPSLDRCGVAQDLLSSELRTTDPSLGSEIPVMYHYLLRQDLGYFFRQGEIVGYEKERTQSDEDGDDRDPMYVYAKVVKKVTSSTSSDSAESNKIDLQARYRIDVGEPKLVEVSVLDLYKFDRSAPDFPTIAQELSDLTDITPFTGDPDSIDNRAATRNTRMENAMKEIKEVLWEAWKLDEKARKKVTKRLFLRWHPDKNPGCDIANEVMKFLLGEIESLERLFPTNWRENAREEKEKTPEPASNFSDLFEKWNQRAHQEWETYNTFKRQKPGASQPGTANPQRKEARRWMKQAKDDLSAAKCLHDQETPFYSFVCFLCQQSAEKAFKGALYSACGIAENQLETHDVLNLAYEITEIDGSPSDIAQLASKLKNYYEKTRYPHYHHGGLIPSDAFTRENAEEALEVAAAVLEKIEEFITANIGEEQ